MTLSRNRASLSVRAAIQAAGGLERVVLLVSEGFASGDSPARRAIQESLRRAEHELAMLNEVCPESTRCTELRHAVETAPHLLNGIESENLAASLRLARACLTGAIGGDRVAVETLALHSSRAGPAFSLAVSAALEDDPDEPDDVEATDFDVPHEDDDDDQDDDDQDDDDRLFDGEEGALTETVRSKRKGEQ